jgi:hypothetical protein
MARSVEPAKAAVAREGLCKRPFRDIFVKRNNCEWEAAFSMLSVSIATWWNNKRTIGRGVFYAVRADSYVMQQ